MGTQCPSAQGALSLTRLPNGRAVTNGFRLEKNNKSDADVIQLEEKVREPTERAAQKGQDKVSSRTQKRLQKQKKPCPFLVVP